MAFNIQRSKKYIQWLTTINSGHSKYEILYTAMENTNRTLGNLFVILCNVKYFIEDILTKDSVGQLVFPIVIYT